MRGAIQSPLLQQALRIAKRLFTPAAILFLAWFAWQGRDTLLDVVASGNPRQLLLAVLLWSCMPLVAPLFSLLVFRALGHRFSYSQLAGIHIGNLPARYIPGGIWHTVGRAAAFSKLGAGKRDIATFVLLENALAVAVAFALGGPLVASYRGLTGWGSLAAAACIGSLLALLALPYLLHYFHKQNQAFTFRRYLSCIGTVATSWGFAASAFVVFLTAFADLRLHASPLEVGGVYLFSWGMGFLAIFAPQGIGVFEAIAGDLLSPPGAFKSVAALMLGFRLIILLSDALVWSAYQATRRTSDRDGDGSR